MRDPRAFLKPLAMGAPDPLREIPVTPSRMIHFLDFSNEKMVAKAPDIAEKVDILLATSKTPCPSSASRPRARAASRRPRHRPRRHRAWARINSLDSPWALDDVT